LKLKSENQEAKNVKLSKRKIPSKNHELKVAKTKKDTRTKMKPKLKGKNKIKLFRASAERLVSKIAAREGVVGIVFLGGVVRGFADRFSDLDIIVFLSRKDEQLRMQIYNLGLEERKRSALDIDLEVHFFREFKKWKWDETDRWDFSHAKIVVDPKGEIKKMFEAKLSIPRESWIRRIATCGEYLRWYCCPTEESIGTIAEAWIDRGGLMSSHYCLNYAMELLLEVLFALNKEFLPPPKWRIFYLYKLKWLPEDYKKLFGDVICVKNLSIEDLSRRLIAVRKIWFEVLPKIRDETGLTPEKMSKYYVDKILEQTWMAPNSKEGK
jgi:predicted nucleotidyltransferase